MQDDQNYYGELESLDTSTPYAPDAQHTQARLSTLLHHLKTDFGYDAFRPYQEKIITDTLNNRDTVAVLPTGAGKSICYQLPAIVSSGTTIVISPLIALMKDQVDQLIANGINSTFINSSLTLPQLRDRTRDFKQNKYKLVYVAPERLVKEDFINILKEIDIARFAIDEAHCISEWGHDFRPEYRQLSLLKKEFPSIPVIALTATATPQVKDDIAKQLNLINPAIHLASFNRPNLSYKVIERQKNGLAQIEEFLKKFKDESGIIYCGTRDQTEELTQDLISAGFSCVAYHAGMPNEERARNQEHFIKDEVNIICATIAFGMGINKPNVRFVIHYDLPKNIEGYYQETGRAGRDGLPSECLLLYNFNDIRRIKWIISQKTDPQDIENSEKQLQYVLSYAQTNLCRRQYLLTYFGEDPKFDNCQNCDNCVESSNLFDATNDSYKLISTVLRIEKLSDLRFGIKHIVQILLGKDSDKIQRWGHNSLSTFGIGADKTEAEWTNLARALVNQGLLKQSFDQYPTITVTNKAIELVKNKSKILLPEIKKDATSTKTKNAKSSLTDATYPQHTTILEALKQLRTKLAREKGVPAYIIFGDVTLEDMAKKLPKTPSQFLELQGVGEVKLKAFGEIFLNEIARLTNITKVPLNVLQSKFSQDESAKRSKESLIRESVKLFNQNVSLDDIAKQLFRAKSTIAQYLEEAIKMGIQIKIDNFVPIEMQERIKVALKEKGKDRLAPIKEMVGEDVSYEQIRIFRAFVE